MSELFDYVPGRFIRKRNRRQRKGCACGNCIILAPAPTRVADGVRYGPGLHAYAVVGKCADSLPLYRQAKILHRTGISINASTLLVARHLKRLTRRCAR